MAVGLSDLPLDVWGRVATFLPPQDRISVFWSLRRAQVLRTERSVFHTLMCFVGEAAEMDQQHARQDMGEWPLLPVWHPSCEDVLHAMGFGTLASVRALVAAGGDLVLALSFLVDQQGNEDA